MDLVEETERKAEGRRQKAEALAWSLRRSASLGASTQYASDALFGKAEGRMKGRNQKAEGRNVCAGSGIKCRFWRIDSASFR